MRILLVEDNLTLASWLAKSLQQSNYNVDTVHDAADAEQALAFTEYNLVILDLGLPDKTGLDVLEQIRNRGNEVPVIILTANASLDGRIRGLDAGADDYLAKPFELSELEARIAALRHQYPAVFSGGGCVAAGSQGACGAGTAAAPDWNHRQQGDTGSGHL
jgi:two-component system response regulator TctD